MSIKNLLDWMIPPADASEQQLSRWRLVQGAATTGLILSTICLYIITAKASDLDEVKASVAVPAMERIHARYCQSVNPETRQILRQQVIRLQINYKKATGIEYPLEDCEEIRRQAER